MYYLAGYLSFIVMRENVEKWRISWNGKIQS